MCERDGQPLFDRCREAGGAKATGGGRGRVEGHAGCRLRNEEPAPQIAPLARGLLSLCDGSFQQKGFEEKLRFMRGLEKLLEGGVQPGASRSLWMLPAASFASGAGREGAGAAECVIPEACVAAIAGVIREDPFPRIRTAAVHVLMRLGTPGTLGTAVADYLPGLLDPEALPACTVLAFVVEHFGHSALWVALSYLKHRSGPCPSAVLRLMEGLCEEHLKGLDVKWALMQLKRLVIRRNENGAVRARDRYLQRMAPLDKFEYARLANFQRRTEESLPARETAERRKKTGKEENTAKGDGRAEGSLERRFLRIRREGALRGQGRRTNDVTHHPGRDLDQRQGNPAGNARRTRARMRREACDTLRGEDRDGGGGRLAEGGIPRRVPSKGGRKRL